MHERGCLASRSIGSLSAEAQTLRWGSIAGSVQRRVQVVAKMYSEAQLVKLRDGCWARHHHLIQYFHDVWLASSTPLVGKQSRCHIMCPSVCLGHSGTPCGGWSSIGKGTLSIASQRRVDFEIICTERVGFSFFLCIWCWLNLG